MRNKDIDLSRSFIVERDDMDPDYEIPRHDQELELWSYISN